MDQRYLFTKFSVLVPAIGNIDAEWRELEDCIWMGHKALRTKRPLGIHEEFTSRPHISHLFRTVLRLEDAKLTTCIDEIIFYKKQYHLLEFDDVDSEDEDHEDDEIEDTDFYGIAEGLASKNYETKMDLSNIFLMYQEIARMNDFEKSGHLVQ